MSTETIGETAQRFARQHPQNMIEVDYMRPRSGKIVAKNAVLRSIDGALVLSPPGLLEDLFAVPFEEIVALRVHEGSR